MPLSLIAFPIIFAVLKVAAVAGIGFLLGKKSILHDSATADISDLVIKVAVPALVFANAAEGSIGLSTTAAVGLLIAGPAVIAAGYLVSVFLAKIGRVHPAYRKAVVAASTFQNSAYLPLAVSTVVAPLVVSTIGGPAMPSASASGASVVCISLFGVLYAPIFWGVGLSWLTDNGRVKRTPAQFVLRMFPAPVIGLIAGYIVGYVPPLHALLVPPQAPLRFLFDAISDIGAITIPLANLVLGAMLARAGTGEAEPVRNHFIVIVTRFLIVPTLFLALLYATTSTWSKDPLMVTAAFVIFLQAITPPATNLAVISKTIHDSNDRTPEAIPRLMLVAYVLCMATMPAWLLIFLHVMHK